MRKVFLLTLVTFAVSAFFSILLASPGHAQSAVQTYLASTGNDSNDCTNIATPCKTFTTALFETYGGGQVSCLDHMTFTASISRSIPVNCEGSNLNAVYIQSGQGETTVVIHGVAIGNAIGFSPVEYDGLGTLILDRVHIGGGTAGESSIKFAPTGPARLMISNSIISKGGNVSNGTGAGLLVQPQPGGTAQVALDSVRIEGNVFGVAIDGSSSTGGINATIRNSTIAGNKQDGIVATTSSGHAPIGVFVANTGSINNAFGIRSIGPNATVRVSDTEIVGNGTGVATLSGGALLSAGNNHVQANGSNGSFSGSIAAQ